MSVITFSRFFLSDHPRAGQPTHFVERIIGNLILLQKPYYGSELWHQPIVTNEGVSQVAGDIMYKGHTIRLGQRFKEGEWFDPRVWSGAPYRSKMIQFAPAIQIVKIWNFHIDQCGVASIDGKYIDEETEKKLARNDGLCYEDFLPWVIMPAFQKEIAMDMQIVCWDPKIQY